MLHPVARFHRSFSIPEIHWRHAVPQSEGRQPAPGQQVKGNGDSGASWYPIDIIIALINGTYHRGHCAAGFFGSDKPADHPCRRWWTHRPCGLRIVDDDRVAYRCRRVYPASAAYHTEHNRRRVAGSGHDATGKSLIQREDEC